MFQSIPQTSDNPALNSPHPKFFGYFFTKNSIPARSSSLFPKPTPPTC